MFNIYKEYCAPVLVGLSSGLSNKLEFTNQFAIRTLMNLSKATPYATSFPGLEGGKSPGNEVAPYGDLLKIVNMTKHYVPGASQKHASPNPSLYIFIYYGPNYIKELFSLQW